MSFFSGRMLSKSLLCPLGNRINVIMLYLTACIAVSTCLVMTCVVEWQKMKAFVYLVFPNSILSVLPEGSLRVGGEPMEHGIITSVTHGVMPGIYHISLFIVFNDMLVFSCGVSSWKLVYLLILLSQ